MLTRLPCPTTAVVLKNAEMEFNFGHSPFKYDPGDYKPISAAPIAETTLGAAGSAGRKGCVHTLIAFRTIT